MVVALVSVLRLGSDDATAEQPANEQADQGWPARPADARDHRILPPVKVKRPSDEFDLRYEVNYKPYARFDPCRPIHVVVNDALAPPAGENLIREALNRVSRATGLAFVLDGSTDEDLDKNRDVTQERYGDGWAPVLIAWTDLTELERRREAAGMGWAHVEGPEQSVRNLRFVSGQVGLDAEEFDRMIFGYGLDVARATIMHELGHLVGLHHSRDRDQLMYWRWTDRTTWGRGDRTGLALMGKGPCFDD